MTGNLSSMLRDSERAELDNYETILLRQSVCETSGILEDERRTLVTALPHEVRGSVAGD
jgi:hypothetical protein